MSAAVTSALVRVVVADGQPLYLDALARLVRQRANLQLIAELKDGWSALERIRADEPEVAVLALGLPGLDGDRVLRAVTREQLSTRIVIVGEASSSVAPYDAIANGAWGYLSRLATQEQLEDAIWRVVRGSVVIAPEAQGAVAAGIRSRERRDATVLTRRERQILALVARGMSTEAMARALYLTGATVRTHRRHVYEKLGVSDRAAAVAEGMRRGLLE
ncbi:MAG TPA: response regulator transcription factor [Solirubrobacter sp.]|nr:response regulator transcription factor [Solirubrobacter sp.]